LHFVGTDDSSIFAFEQKQTLIHQVFHPEESQAMIISNFPLEILLARPNDSNSWIIAFEQKQTLIHQVFHPEESQAMIISNFPLEILLV
jgi:hypothetical protein